MKLLLVTDHRFYVSSGGVYDVYQYDRKFFEDYRAVFEEVRVAARAQHEPPPRVALRSDSEGVRFVPLQDVRGARWALAPRSWYCGALEDAVRWADAVCVRIPSVAGAVASRLARRMRRPVMFELIGDPAVALRTSGYGALARLYGVIEAHRTRSVVRRSVAGFYVSKAHLQRRYPARNGTVIDSISDIRLPASALRPAKQYPGNPSPLRLVLVATFVAVKQHDLLLRAASEAVRRGTCLELHLVGDGPLRRQTESLARELGLLETVRFYGQVADRERVFEVLDAAHLFVMTSASEGMPRAMIEAMARGLPAIGASTGGIEELLPREQRFTSGNVAQLAAMLCDLSRAPQTLSAFARYSEAVAREFVEDTLSRRRQRLLRVLRGKARGAES